MNRGLRERTPLRRRALRTIAAAAVLAAAVALTPGFGAAPHLAAATAAGVGDCNADASWPTNRQDFADQVVALVNQHRAELGLVQLKVSPTLTAAAVWKSRHMAQYGYMQHDDPAPPVARTWFQRVQACGYTGSGAGENIAYGYATPADVMNGWLNSSGHKANIENSSYRAIGVGAAGSSRIYWSQDFGTTDDSGSTPQPDTIAPSVPGLLTASAVSSSQVNLQWGASTDNVGVAGYRVYRNSVQVGTTSLTSYSDTGRTAATTYTYTVRAYDAAGNVGSSSNSASVTTPSAGSADTTAPSAPTGVTASAASSMQVNVSWTGSTDNVGVAGYRVYRGGVQVGTTSSTSYADTGLTAGTTYSYTVRAYDAAGNLSASSSSASATTSAAGGGGSATTAYPYAVQLRAGSISGGSASSLGAQDGSTFDVAASTYSRLSDWSASIASTNSITALSVTYAGSSTLSCTRTISLYDWTLPGWRALDTRTASTTSSKITVTATGSLDRYVSNSAGAGDVRVRVACTRTDSLAFTVKSDLLSITIS